MIRLMFSLALLLGLVQPALAEAPLTVQTKFGPVTLPAHPQRVATLDYSGVDDLLALGVQPVALRYWYGDHPDAVWPWAAPLLQGHPQVLRGDLNIEQLAATHPDLIIALWSGIDAAQFRKLSLIAPVLAVPPETADFGLPWETRARLTGLALGKSAEVEALIARIDAQLDAVARAHPDWQGKTAAVAFDWDGTPGAYTSRDVRAQLLARLGFVTPPAIEALASAPDQFTVSLSPEDLSPLEADLILWVATDNAYEAVESLPTRPFLQAVQQGHEVFSDVDLGGALSYSSLLSLPYAIERLVPEIEAVLKSTP